MLPKSTKSTYSNKKYAYATTLNTLGLSHFIRLSQNNDTKFLSGTCGAPFTFVAGGCYEFLTIGVSWEDARTVCQSSGADLAIVDDCSVMTEIINYISAAGI